LSLGAATYTGLAASFSIAVVYAWLESLLRYRNVKANLPGCAWVWVYVLVNALGADIAYLALSNGLRPNLTSDPTVGLMLVAVASISSWGILRASLPHSTPNPGTREATQRVLALVKFFQDKADEQVYELDDEYRENQRRSARSIVANLSTVDKVIAERLVEHCHRLSRGPQRPSDESMRELMKKVTAIWDKGRGTEREKRNQTADELIDVYGLRKLRQAVEAMGELPTIVASKMG
jgi:hypothetical protein